MLLKLKNIQGPHLFHQAIDNFNSGQVAPMRRTIKALSGKRFLMQRSVRISIKKTAKLVLKLANSLHGFFAQCPYQILARQPLATDNRVHEVTFDGVARIHGYVVSALNHARAP